MGTKSHTAARKRRRYGGRDRPSIGRQVAVLVGVFGGIFGVMSAAASDGLTPTHPASDAVFVEDPDEALALTAELIAKSNGIDVREAQSRLAHQLEVDEFLPDVAEKLGDRFAGSRLVETATGYETEIIVAGSFSDAESAFGAVPEGVRFVDGAPFGRADASAIVEETHRSLETYGFESYASAIDIESGVITVEVAATDLARTQMTSNELSAEVTARFADERSVEFRTVEGPVAVDEHSYGGAQMLDDGASECTSGFAATRFGVDGVLTAAHCEGINEIREQGCCTYDAPWVREHLGTHGDFEFHSTTHWEYARFYWDTNTLFDVNAVKAESQMGEGDDVCNYGRASDDPACSQIDKVGICSTVSGQTACNLVRMEDHLTTFGDSGGPWYVGTTAWGVHKGVQSSKSTFSIAERAWDALDATIKQ